ncbi:MAG: PepSY-like domain-containing protein [Bacteroidota bacterium]|nr:PepSY-like domain-containing protein [Bacteroidota bacterium]MDP3144855.1 PepSY-like domain-containing protein [Bacteroidota bacterium]MDP3555765.1 PepSY-like domain-containing protein [Bacteroidota bacterium]
MKTIITAAVLVFAINTLSAQKIKEAEVPKAVTESFAKNFPGSKAKEWEKEKDLFEAEFDLKKVETSATFSADGKLMETESEIATSALPKAVTEYITKNYPSYKLSEASKITDASGKVSYEAEIKKGKEEIDLIFDSNGTFIKKEVEEHDTKDKD